MVHSRPQRYPATPLTQHTRHRLRGRGCGVGPTYLHEKGLSHIFFERWDDGVTELALSPVLGWQSAGAGAWGLLAVGAPRDRSCARRERWGRLGFRAIARGRSGCRRSNARCGPVPLPPGAPSGILYAAKSRSLSTGWDWVPSRVLVCTRDRGRPQLETATGQPTQDDDRSTDFV